MACPVAWKLAGTTAALLCATGALAQVATRATTSTGDTSQPVFGRQDGLGGVHFGPVSTSLSLLGRYSHSSNGDRWSSETQLQEMLDLATHGYIFDPKFIDLSLEGAFGLSQTREDDNAGGSGNSYGTLYTYNARATMFSQRDATLSLYGQRTDQVVNMPFAASVEQTIDTYGADLNLKSQTVTTTFRLYHTEEHDTSLGDAADQQQQNYSLKQDNFEWRSQVKTANQSLSWLYQYSHVSNDSGTSGATNYDSQTADLVYALSFGPANQSTWTNSFDYYSQTGDFPQERLRGATNLTLHHSATFETFAEYNYDRNTYESSTTTLQRGAVGFRHELWGSLTTTGRLGANALDNDSGPVDREQYGIVIFDYTKNVPSGRFSANLSLLATRQENYGSTEPINIIAAPYAFSDPRPLTIGGRNIVPSSIRLTNSTNTRTYVEGVDYTLLWFPTYVQILRSAGGAIPPNGSVLIDYTMEPQPQSTVWTYVTSTGCRYDVTEGPAKGLGAYVQGTVQEQSVDTADPAYQAEQIHDVTLGLDYHVGNWMWNGEYEHHNSSIAPFDAWRTGLQYSRRLDLNTTFAGDINYVDYHYYDSSDRLRIATAAATVERQFSTHLSGTATIGCFNQDDSLTGQTTGAEGSLGLRWNYGKTQVYTNVRAVHLDQPGGASQFEMFEVGITRRF